jgi:DNA polymerase-3 subunit delta
MAARRTGSGGSRAAGPTAPAEGTTLSLRSLKQELSQGRIRRIYLLLGGELILKRDAVAAIEVAVLGPRGAPGEPLPAAYSLNRQRFAGEEARASDILAACQGIPMFGERRLVVVEGVDQLRKADRDLFLPGLSAIPETAVLVLMASQLDGRLTFTRDLKARAALVPVEGLEERELLTWIRHACEERERKISPEAAAELLMLAGPAMTVLAGEIEKISLYARPGAAINVEHVRQVAAGGRGEALDELLRAITDRKSAPALRALHQTLDAGEEPIRILALLQYRLTDLWRCADRVGGWYRDEVRRGAALWPPDQAAAAVAALAQADRVLKGGEGGLPLGRRGGDRLVLELLVEQITAPGAPSPATAPGRDSAPRTRRARG